MTRFFNSTLLVLFLGTVIALPSCGREESSATKIKAYAEALNLVKPAYRMMRDHHMKPGLAGKMFSDYMKAHRDPLIAAYKNYNRVYGDGKNISAAEKKFLERETGELERIKVSPEVTALMKDESFQKASREGFETLREAQDAGKK
jgi:hypothetical protein